MKVMVYILVEGRKYYGELDTERNIVRLSNGKNYPVDVDGKITYDFKKYTLYNALEEE